MTRLTDDERIKDIQDVSIAIDSWDDIFSDFDPSPLEKRVLSEDFLLELRKRYRETKLGKFLITIYAPKNLEDEKTQQVVISRLKQYFKFRELVFRKEIKRERKKGFLFVFLGMFSLVILTLITYFHIFNELFVELIGIVLMPLGWFGVWEGFSLIINPGENRIKELALFEKLAKSTIRFKY